MASSRDSAEILNEGFTVIGEAFDNTATNKPDDKIFKYDDKVILRSEIQLLREQGTDSVGYAKYAYEVMVQGTFEAVERGRAAWALGMLAPSTPWVEENKEPLTSAAAGVFWEYDSQGMYRVARDFLFCVLMLGGWTCYFNLVQGSSKAGEWFFHMYSCLYHDSVNSYYGRGGGCSLAKIRLNELVHGRWQTSTHHWASLKASDSGPPQKKRSSEE